MPDVSIAELLSGEEAQWLDVTEPRRVLGLHWDDAVLTWARLGLLRCRTLLDERVQVFLDDVLRQSSRTQPTQRWVAAS